MPCYPPNQRIVVPMEPPASATYMRVAVLTQDNIQPGSLVWGGHQFVDANPHRSAGGDQTHAQRIAASTDCMPLVKTTVPAAAANHSPIGVTFDVPTTPIKKAGTLGFLSKAATYTVIAIAVAGVVTLVQRPTQDTWPPAHTYPGCFVTMEPSGTTKTMPNRTDATIGMIVDVQLPVMAPTAAQREANLLHIRVKLL